MSVKNILVVDDDNNILKFITQILKNNYNVKTASNGLQALNILQNDNFDMIICDVEMPVMNGIEFYNKINERGKKIPFLFISGNIDNDPKIESEKFLQKPFRISELLSLIQNA